jgi:hypothetical protein
MEAWEPVTEGETGGSFERTERLQVPGGWLYRTTIIATRPNGDLMIAAAVAVDLEFVPAVSGCLS